MKRSLWFSPFKRGRNTPVNYRHDKNINQIGSSPTTHSNDLFSSDFHHPAMQLLSSEHFQSYVHQILS